jgi:hypothetical protein
MTTEADTPVAGHGAIDLDDRAGGEQVHGDRAACRLWSRNTCAAGQEVAQVVLGQS